MYVKGLCIVNGLSHDYISVRKTTPEGIIMKCTEYLEAIKAKHQIKSDNALAEYLGIHRQMVSNYKKDRHYFDNKTAVIIAEELGIDPMRVIQDMEVQRAKDEKTREFWINLRPLQAAAFTGIAVLSSASDLFSQAKDLLL